MFEFVKNFFRRRKIQKFRSQVETSFLPIGKIATVNAVIDVQETGFDQLKEDILAWGRRKNIKVNIYFFDFRKLDKEELLLTSIQTTIIKKDLDWIGVPELSKVIGLLGETSDLFISMINNGDFPIDFLSKCTKARFKIGRYEYEGHAYDLVISGNQTADLRSDSKRIFAAIKEFLTKIQ